jgi:hypothetical protein|tara:strand:- start:320 stop:568 length:249 start_codon:yes stop_codon:yes gene_type:complete
MVSIDTLIKIYNNFGDREKLSPLGSADEEIMWNDKLTDKQVNWLERFVIVWDYATNLDVQLCKRKLIKAKLKRSKNDESELD